MSLQRVYNVSIDPYTGTKNPLQLATTPTLSPTRVDLRSKMPPIYNQGQLGSCTANALCAAVQYEQPHLHGSRLFVYYNERVLENDIPDDAGANLGDGVKTLCQYGVCKEASWPYDISRFQEKPPQICYDEAAKHTVYQDYSIPNDQIHMKNTLASGYPFVVGISVYSSFESDTVAQTGVVPMPTPADTCLGGHAVLCVGYDDTQQMWIMRNSWGHMWGDHGYFYLPYSYLLDSSLASDLWVITAVH
jgi:C1A family cysteine protease